jgi:hypothetical protein
VVDAKREPMAGVRVYVSDATLFGAVDDRPALLEGVLSGAEGTVELGRDLTATAASRSRAS